jgi:hypothetical protein
MQGTENAMNRTLRNVSLILGGLVAAAGLLVRQPTDGPGLKQVLPVTRVATTARIDVIALPEFRADAEAELSPGPDTTGLLQESLSIGELLDEVSADAGEAFTAADRERLEAALRSDPEIRRSMSE